MKAVGFDFGQTLAELDYEFVRARLSERGQSFDPASAAARSERAWQIYGERKADGHAVAWSAMMQAQLEGGGVPAAAATSLARWLWEEQPKRNLWRRPISGMIELVRELKRADVKVAVISNSEGYLAELIDELRWSDAFDVVVDSGRLGIDKPDARIFQHACRVLGVEPSELLHVGDAWEADVQGALGAGASAVWFDARYASRTLPARVYGADGPSALREVLARLGLVS
jgi:HAD superfamily hydrolase (TIGR01509 family)